MTDEQRAAIERLERRVEVLETLVRKLAETRSFPEPVRPRARPPAAATPAPAPLTAPSPAPLATPPASRLRIDPTGFGATTDLEQWFGQRGLLIVGSVALLVAAAFFLKYAFDRGWIPPLVRSALAVASGVGVAAWGEQRLQAGMRRYGAAMIGAGGGLVFLGLWAAAGPYGLIDRRVGVLLLAATTVLVTLLALRHQIEGLALWALVGAYLAPLVLPPPVPNPDAFLGYLEVIGLGTGLLAYTMRWRITFNLALYGYLLLAVAGAGGALQTTYGCWLLAAGAALTLHVTHRRPWPEARLGILILSWLILGASLSGLASRAPSNWLAFSAAVAVWGLLWWQQVERDPFAANGADAAAGVERALFVLNPVVLLLVASVVSLWLLENHLGWLAALLAVVYLAVGWLRRSPAFVMMGFGLGAIAMALEWRPSTVVLGWTALAAGALALERWGGRPGGRIAAIALATGALGCLFTAALEARNPAAPVFADAWAFALYVYVLATALCALRWGVETQPTPWERSGAELVWVLCGAAVFAGGSVEFSRYFGTFTRLARDLALSVWWLVFAGALVFLGFRLNRKGVRSAGLAVAAGAGLKIVLYDLSNLEALYRVASFFALALIALTVAYAYNKRALREPV